MVNPMIFLIRKHFSGRQGRIVVEKVRREGRWTPGATPARKLVRSTR
jgi:hypothetical protein